MRLDTLAAAGLSSVTNPSLSHSSVDGSQLLHSASQCKTRVLTARYDLHLQRLQVHPDTKALPLTQIQQLRSGQMKSGGSGSNAQQSVLLFGLLSSNSMGDFVLEQMDGLSSCTLALDISPVHTQVQQGIYCECQFVLCEGRLNEMTSELRLSVDTLAMIPSEMRFTTVLNLHPELAHIKQQRQQKRLLQQLVSPAGGHESDMILCLSDLLLTEVSTWRRLRLLLTTFNEQLVDDPQMNLTFVLCGDFTRPTATQSQALHSIQQLSDLIYSYSHCAQLAKFVFILGPHDFALCPSSLWSLPRASMSRRPAKRLRQRLTHCEFQSSPAHLHYYSQHIIVHRADTYAKLMSSHIIHSPCATPMQNAESYVSTLLNQCHLSPVSQQQQPVFWAQDAAMSLYPLPHVLMLCDSSMQQFVCDHSATESDLEREQREQAWALKDEDLRQKRLNHVQISEEEADYKLTHELKRRAAGVIASNSGSFCRTGEFLVYFPHSNRIEQSAIE